MKNTFTSEEKEILNDALTQLDKFYDEQISKVQDFKWICHDYLPQAGEEYIRNINVFEISTKTVKDLKNTQDNARKIIMNIINNY